ncbi:MAG: UDP-N-acetylmuramoyl-tripeptide--D-alanyl-D-alanine ligase [Bacteroidetes bacterium]|nr:MAG: UDP-N-acetylmuramoyl-tripeptide--D-alanyl-D-alanine ligase [Bacteroidota bacterium]
MKTITATDLKKLTGAAVTNGDALKRRKLQRVCTDSRSVRAGDLFVALKGETFDAHTFLDAVLAAEPSALLVHHGWARENAGRLASLPCAVCAVPDTTAAFGELARTYRRKFGIPVIAVGGSNGKTTTKEMVTAVLRTRFEVLATEGNLNNHIGVPQTLFRLDEHHGAAVVEIGTNHFGELRHLCAVAEPTHGLLTNIGREHLEFFGDEAGVAKEETELFRHLAETKGFVFLNADDPYLAKELKGLKRVLSYGAAPKADVRVRRVHAGPTGAYRFQLEWGAKDITVPVRLSVPGAHNVINAAAAAAVGLKLGVRPKRAAEALAAFVSASKRMEVMEHVGVTVLNDTYNSNPDSVMAALRTLVSVAATGRKVAVLGDMRELGEASKREHTGIGAAAAEMPVDRLYTFGTFSKYTQEAFGGERSAHYESKEALSADLKAFLRPGDVVLVKGSRGMRMEDVTAVLVPSAAGQTRKEH